MPVEDSSPHALGAIQMKGVLTESLASLANPIPDYLSSRHNAGIPANWCILSAENVRPLWCKKANWLLLRSCQALL